MGARREERIILKKKNWGSSASPEPLVAMSLPQSGLAQQSFGATHIPPPPMSTPPHPGGDCHQMTVAPHPQGGWTPHNSDLNSSIRN